MVLRRIYILDWIEVNLRRKYQIKAFFTPMCWTRNGVTDSLWDSILWKSLEDGKIELVGAYEAIIDGHVVWIENYPYASGRRRMSGRNDLYCSRATALFLHNQLKEALIFQRLKGPFDKHEVFRKTGIQLA